MSFIGYDEDGTPWVTVRFTIDVAVIADSKEDAIYHAELALIDYLDTASAEVVEFDD